MTIDTIEKVKIVIPKPHSEAQREFVECMAKRQIIKAGRRFGKTVGAAIKALKAFLGICPFCETGCSYCDFTKWVTPMRVLYTAPTAEQVNAFWFEVVRALDKAIEMGIFKKDESEKYIEKPGTKLRIKAKTVWNADSARGDYAKLAIMEEYQLMAENAWSDVIQPMLLDEDGIAVFIFTPPSLQSQGISKAKDPRHASKMFKNALSDKTGRWAAFHHTSFDNPLLSKIALAEIGKDMSADSFRREIMAEDDEIEDSWLVYNKFNEDKCKIKHFKPPKEWPIVSAHDFGSANPAALFCAKVKLPLPDKAPPSMRYGDYYLWSEYAPGGRAVIQHIEEFKKITEGYKVEHSVGGNITTEDETRQAYTTNGWTITSPPINKVNAQIDRVISLLEMDKLFISEELFGLLTQIANCMFELDEENKPKNKIKDEPKYHFLACLRYLAAYLPAERIPTEGETEKIKVGVY